MPKIPTAKGSIKKSTDISCEMLRRNTPIEDHTEQYGLWVKREDLSCLPPGPPFSKARGVFSHLQNIKEKTIGVLDTYHSQGGWAVARACQILGKKCVVFYPEFKHDPGYRNPQQQAKKLGAKLVGLPAGRSAILFHSAKKQVLELGGYMVPNALKLQESVEETAKEVPNQKFDNVLVSISSGTLAAGVIKGFANRKITIKKYLIHLGYSRSLDQVVRYLEEKSGQTNIPIQLIDEKYGYKDKAEKGVSPPFPCNPWYDLKAFRWWLSNQESYSGVTLFWNIG
jgi:hypothetical protein